MQEAHRDVLADFKVVSSIVILAGLWAAAPGCRSTVAALPGSRLRSWPPHVGRAVRGCCVVVRAGRMPVGPGVKVELEAF